MTLVGTSLEDSVVVVEEEVIVDGSIVVSFLETFEVRFKFDDNLAFSAF